MYTSTRPVSPRTPHVASVLHYNVRPRNRRLLGTAVALLLAVGLAAGGSVALSLFTPPAGAQARALMSNESTGAPSGAGITVIGEGVIRAKPDTITLRLGIEASAQTPSAALTQTRTSSERVIQKLRELGVPDADAQTIGLNVFRVQDGPPMGPTAPTAQSGAATTYRGYAAVAATLSDVNRAGALLDAAMQAGATSLEHMQVGLRDDAALRLTAVAAAIRDSRPQAEAIADAAGLRLGGVLAVTELAGPGPVRLKAGGGVEGFAPGELAVTVSVQVTYDVVP